MNNEKDLFLEAAAHIGYKLAREAIWYDQRCNWISEEVDYNTYDHRIVAKAMNSEIYAGQSGVALFLNDLYSKTEDAIIKNTLEGCISNLIENYDQSKLNYSYYEGNLGVLEAIYRSALLLERSDWEVFAKSELTTLINNGIDTDECELLYGVSGSVASFRRWSSRFEDFDASSVLERIGNHIILHGQNVQGKLEWQNTCSSNTLTGYSHGAAGISAALFEINEVIPDSKYVDAAYKGIVFERQHFNPKYQNWIDLRQQDSSHNRDSSNCFVGWCHGAPGIGLARLHSWKFTADEALKKEAIQAFDTTMQYVYQGIDNHDHTINYSLCHGLAGNADVLLTAGKILNDEKYVRAAYDIGHYGLGRFQNTGLDWPSGSINPQTSKALNVMGLMLGIAGIGYFYLRLAHDDIESCLMG